MRECPECKRQCEDSHTECEFCGIVFDKWHARQKQLADAKDIVQLHDSVTDAGPALKTAGPSFLRIAVYFLAGLVLLSLLYVSLIKPGMDEGAKKDALKFCAAVENGELDAVQGSFSSVKGAAFVKRHGGLDKDLLSYFKTRIPGGYTAGRVSSEGISRTVPIYGSGAYEGETGKIFLTPEAGRFKVDGFEFNGAGRRGVRLPGYLPGFDMQLFGDTDAAALLPVSPADLKGQEQDREILPYSAGLKRGFKEIKTFSGLDGASLAFSEDGKHLLAASYGAFTIKMWDTADYFVEREFKLEFRPNTISAMPVGWKSFVIGDVNENLTRLPYSGKPVIEKCVTGGVFKLSCGRNNLLLATASAGNLITLRNVATEKELMSIDAGFGLTSIALSPAGPYLAAGTSSNKFIIWDLKTGNGKVNAPESVLDSAHCAGVNFSPDGKNLAVGYSSGQIYIYDIERGECFKSFSAAGPSVKSLTFTADGRALISGQQDGKTAVWDVSSGRKLQELKGHTGSVGSVAVSPNNDLIATADEAGKVVVWGSK